LNHNPNISFVIGFVFHIITALNLRPQFLILGLLRIRGIQSVLVQAMTMTCSDQATWTKVSSTYNGTATVSLKKGPVTGVPISIKLMGPSAMSLWIDPSKTESHFGNTPIYGVQARVMSA
jgi:hypothetical protein